MTPSERLGRAVAERLQQLSLSQRAAAEASKAHDPSGKGLSFRTITSIVAGATSPQPRSLGILERTLGWPQGMAQSILEGGEPPGPEDFNSPGQRWRIVELEGQVLQMRQELVEMRRLLAEVLDEREDGDSP